jgi:hypothetical protein
VGAFVCLVHPDRVLAALSDAALAEYVAKRSRREQHRVAEQVAIFHGTRPSVRLRTTKDFESNRQGSHPGFDPEHAAILDASARRFAPNGPIVAGRSS